MIQRASFMAAGIGVLGDLVAGRGHLHAGLGARALPGSRSEKKRRSWHEQFFWKSVSTASLSFIASLPSLDKRRSRLPAVREAQLQLHWKMILTHCQCKTGSTGNTFLTGPAPLPFLVSQKTKAGGGRGKRKSLPMLYDCWASSVNFSKIILFDSFCSLPCKK